MRALRLFAGYLAAFAVLTAPWLAQAAHAIPINSPYARGDTRLLTWILWWVSNALLNDPRVVVDAPINYPAPAQLTGSEHFAGLQVVFFPIWLLTRNPVLALNAVLFLAYPLAALAMNRLLTALGVSRGVAWVAGLAYALGALQAPAHVHLLHTLAFFPPAAVLALHRLRERPDARRAAPLAALLLLAFFSAYYTTAILLAVLLVCGVAALRRPLPDARRFALVAGSCVAGALLVLAIASQPYLARGATVEASGDAMATARNVSVMSTAYVLLSPVEVFGATALLLGVAGIAALRVPRLRPLAALGLALVAAGVFLLAGGPAAVVHLLPGGPLTDAAQTSLSFFRIAVRWTVVSGLGLAFLGAAALEAACARLSPGAGRLLLASVVALLLADRGRLLWEQTLDTPAALTSDAEAYHALARVVQRDGGGPLLEVPLASLGRSLQPEAMLGEIAHGQPLIVGHTGYLPPHRAAVDAAIARLPADDAVQDLVDMTLLRWVVVRPAEDWDWPGARARYLERIERVPGVHRVADVNGWSVLEIDRTPVHRERFAAIAQGGSARPPLAVSAAAQQDRRAIDDLASARADAGGRTSAMR